MTMVSIVRDARSGSGPQAPASDSRSLRVLQWVPVVVLVLLAAGCAPRVGVVDSQRVLNESVLALSFQKQLDDREKAMVTDLRLLSAQLGKDDLEARRQTYLNELAALRRDLEAQLNQRIRQAVAEVARRRRLRVVLVKQAVRLGGIDVTQDVIDRLK